MPLLTYPKFQAPDINGVNMDGGKVYFYETGTTTPKNTWSDEAKTVLNTNPVILNARGEADIYLTGEYKIILKTSEDVEVWTADSFTGNTLAEDLASTVTDDTDGGFHLVSIPPSATETNIENHAFSRDNVLRYIPVSLHAGIRARTDTTDLTTYVDNGIFSINAGGGGHLKFPPGTYHGTFTLLDKVTLIGEIIGIVSLGQTEVSILKAPTAGGNVISDGASVDSAGIMGLGFVGQGAGIVARGINFTDANRVYIGHCTFNNFSDQAILFGSGSIACKLEKIFAQNCLLDRTQAAKVGVIELDGTDHFFAEAEVTASVSSLSDANAYLCAILVKGSNHFLNALIGEISDVGTRLECTTSRIVNCRSDLNYGNGWEVTGTGNQISNSLGLSNGLETDDTYDNWYITGGTNQFSSCTSGGSQANKHKYGFQDTINSNTTKNWYVNCRDTNAQTKSFLTQDFAGSAVVFPSGPAKAFTAADATPDIDQYGDFVTADTTTYTDFDNPVSGQQIRIRAAHAAILTNGANIKTNTGANVTMVVNKIYTLTSQNGVWYQAE